MKKWISLLCCCVVLMGCGRTAWSPPQFEDLPSNVQKTVRTQIDPKQITRIQKEKDDHLVVYRVDFKQNRDVGKLWVAQNGTLLEDSRRKVIKEAAGAELNFEKYSLQGKFQSLPPAVQKTVLARRGPLEISDIKKVKRGRTTLYAIEFNASGENPVLYVAKNGEVIEDQRDIFKQ